MTDLKFTWKGLQWCVGHPWGQTHPDKPNSWFSPETVNIVNDVLELSILDTPRTFSEDMGGTKEFAVGLVSCLEPLGYGKYTWKCKMPEGTNLWPALWTCGWGSWPPEIDMVEGYTYTDDYDYIKNIFVTSLKTNIHYGTASNHKSAHSKGISTIYYKLFHKDIDEYSFEWTKDYVKFYFNGHKIRTISKPEIMKCLNKLPLCYPIMNLEIREDYNMEDYVPGKSVFRIYDFKYTPIN